MGLFNRKRSAPDTAQLLPVTDQLIRQIADHVNNGRPDEASALAEQTADPQQTALAAFRYID
ncbi:hypothetical protein KCMC57_65180 (plasmid) [Kitasatospora sp. CMC57]|uniref:Uncharacterized protein n=1 Tax=Kitasatospora sp. CMC57 TaxID=3231513 RepID=A0AB33K7J6_9ACTN